MTKTAIPQSNVYIFANINEEIITNIDIEKEIKYLRFLNKNMSQLSDKKSCLRTTPNKFHQCPLRPSLVPNYKVSTF